MNGKPVKQKCHSVHCNVLKERCKEFAGLVKKEIFSEIKLLSDLDVFAMYWNASETQFWKNFLRGEAFAKIWKSTQIIKKIFF